MGAVFLAGYLAVSAQAQSIQAPIETLDLPSTVTHIIIPQHRVIAIRGTISQGVALVGVDADIVIRERFARTTLDISLSYQVHRRATLFVNARNVTNVWFNNSRYQAETPVYARRSSTNSYGAQWSFGLKGTF